MILVDPNSCCEIQVDADMENAIGVEGRGQFWMSGDHYFKWIACTCLWLSVFVFILDRKVKIRYWHMGSSDIDHPQIVRNFSFKFHFFFNLKSENLRLIYGIPCYGPPTNLTQFQFYFFSILKVKIYCWHMGSSVIDHLQILTQFQSIRSPSTGKSLQSFPKDIRGKLDNSNLIFQRKCKKSLFLHS